MSRKQSPLEGRRRQPKNDKRTGISDDIASGQANYASFFERKRAGNKVKSILALLNENICANTVSSKETTDLPSAEAHAEQISSHGGADVFWDAFEQDPTSLQARTSVASFGDMARNDSGYWTDSDQLGPLSWSSCSNYPTFPDQLEDNYFTPPVDNSDMIEGSSVLQVQESVCHGTHTNSASSYIVEAQGLIPQPQDSPSLSDEAPNRTYTALLENHDQISLNPPAPLSEQALMCSEDPFMGWGDKKNHLFDDYGWVLSHVENL